MDSSLEALADRLSRLATHYDISGEWPAQSLDHLTQAGAWTWIIPREYGGMGLDPLSQTLAYEAVAAGCMSGLLILTQRDAACELIAGGENPAMREELLPRLARHEIMTSVGISQLTTSRQGGRPAMTAREDGDGFVLSGCMPWVSGARKCQMLVTGAVLADGRQILAVVPMEREGVTVDPPMHLAALEASQTSEVHLRNVHLGRGLVIRGPMPDVLKSRSTVKPLVVATAGIGLAGAMVRQMRPAADKASGSLKESFDELVERYEAVRERLYSIASALVDQNLEVPKTQIRVAVNDLLIRLAVGLTTFAKGSGFMRQMDAQRLAREAMFFLVWSAPEDVRAGTLASLLEREAIVSKSMEY